MFCKYGSIIIDRDSIHVSIIWWFGKKHKITIIDMDNYDLDDNFLLSLPNGTHELAYMDVGGTKEARMVPYVPIYNWFSYFISGLPIRYICAEDWDETVKNASTGSIMRHLNMFGHDLTQEQSDLVKNV